MGTPGNVIVRSEHGDVVSIHYQCDGYPDGVQLDKILATCGEIRLVNGYTEEDKAGYPGTFNGAQCFAAYLIAKIVDADKDDIGHIYIQPVFDKYTFGYNYEFIFNGTGRPTFKVINNDDQKVLFEGFFEDCDFMHLEDEGASA